MHRNSRLTLIVTTALIATLGACGDDDNDSAAPPSTVADAAAGAGAATGAAADTTVADAAADATTADTTVADASDGAAAGNSAICDPYIEVTMAFSGEPEDPAALLPLLDEAEAVAPAEIESHVETMVAAAREFIESGGQDSSGFDSPEFTEAMSTVDPWMFEHCEFDQQVEVTATDFAFTGLGAELDSGRTVLLLTNNGNEAHEIVVMRKAEGTTESWGELLELPEEEVGDKVIGVGGAFAGAPGSEGLMVADLEPGDYIAVCFVPSGTSMDAEDGSVTEGSGVPHHVSGMRHEFTVR